MKMKSIVAALIVGALVGRFSGVESLARLMAC